MKNLLLFVSFCFVTSAYAQSELWSRTVSKDAFIKQLEDGKIFLKDRNKISLINNKSGKIEWENMVSITSDPEFLTDLPIMFFEGDSYAVIDVTSGYIIDQSDLKTKILKISYFWEKGRVVLELERNNNLYVLNIDLKNISNSWNTRVGPIQKSKAGFTAITSEGSLVIVDKKTISILTKEGKIKRRLEFNKKLEALEINNILNILYVIEDNKKLHFIDVASGKALVFVSLKNDNVMLQIFGEESNICIVQDYEIRVLDGVTSQQLISHKFSDKINKTFVDKDSRKLYVLAKYKLAQIDAKNKIRSVSFVKEFNDLFTVFDKTIISGKSGSSPINLETLKLEYPKLTDIPVIHDFIEFGEYTCYIFYGLEKFKIYAVDKDGNIVWKKSSRSINLPSLDVVGDGLLIVSDSEVSYLSVEDGKSIWNDKVTVNASFTYGIDSLTNDMYMYSNKRLYKFDYSSGTLAKSTDKLKFKDFDYASLHPQLYVLDDAIFMKGSNTIFVLEKDGTIKHEKTYKRISNGSTILELANVVFASVAIATGTVADEAINESWYYAEEMKYHRRTKQNRFSNVYPYVFTKLDDGKRGLIFINPSTGEERFSILLDEKNPAYIIDEYDGILFHLNKTELIAYDLK